MTKLFTASPTMIMSFMVVWVVGLLTASTVSASSTDVMTWQVGNEGGSPLHSSSVMRVYKQSEGGISLAGGSISVIENPNLGTIDFNAIAGGWQPTCVIGENHKGSVWRYPFSCVGSENYASTKVGSAGEVSGMAGAFSKSELFGDGRIAWNYGYYIFNPIGTRPVDINYGLYIAKQTYGKEDIGILIEGADDWSIWVKDGKSRFDGGIVSKGTDLDTIIEQLQAKVKTLETQSNLQTTLNIQKTGVGLNIVGYQGDARLVLGTSGGNVNARNWEIGANNINYDDLNFRVSTSETGAPSKSIMTLRGGSGNVGIGTKSPSSLLHVSGAGGTLVTVTGDLLVQETVTTSADGTITAEGTSSDRGGAMRAKSNAAMIEMRAGGTVNQNSQFGTVLNDIATVSSGDSSGMLMGTTNAVYLSFGTSNLRRMTIDPSGNVGIGTTNPQSLLHINGAGNTYLQIDVSSGTPASADCDSESKRGRMIIDSDTATNKLWVCFGSNGWKGIIAN